MFYAYGHSLLNINLQSGSIFIELVVIVGSVLIPFDTERVAEEIVLEVEMVLPHDD